MRDTRLFLSSLGWLLVSSLDASTIEGVFNTGVDAGGNLLAIDDVDQHWTLEGQPGQVLKAAPPGSDWVHGSEAGWIVHLSSPENNQQMLFETRFTLSPEADLMTVVLKGSFAAYSGAQVFLNGWHIYGPWEGNGAHFRRLWPFEFWSGLEYPYTPVPDTPFVHGENVLSFAIAGRDGIRALLVTGVQPFFKAETAQTGPRCVSVRVRNDLPIRGGEIGLAYDPAAVSAFRVEPGADLPRDSDVHFRLDPQLACDFEAGTRAGLTVAWLNPLDPDLATPPGTHELLRVCFRPAAGAEGDVCSPLLFTRCLGVPGAPVENVVTTDDARTMFLRTADGQVCLESELSFRRGDANEDGRFDISDPIGALGCLFLGTTCAACPDAIDANDDGLVNIADPVYLLLWRFSDGPQPPAPFTECGTDGTADELGDCDAFGPCQ